MNITSSKKTTETRHARVDAENGESLTLNEVEAFVEAARQAQVPGDTVIKGPGMFLSIAMPIATLVATATIEVEG